MELSFPEILLVCTIALLVLGPKELVKSSQAMGRMVGKFKTQLNNFKVMINEEIDLEKKVEEMTKLPKELEIKKDKDKA
jgi:sec-independent protein translocase protein TatB